MEASSKTNILENERKRHKYNLKINLLMQSYQYDGRDEQGVLIR